MLTFTDILIYLQNNYVEFIGVISGLAFVILSVKENTWCWVVGMINSITYFFVFQSAGLYADTGLQVLYSFLNLVGIWEWWLKGKKRSFDVTVPDDDLSSSNSSVVSISTIPVNQVLLYIGITLILWLILYSILLFFNTASVPLLDSLLSAMSIVATYLMTRKVIVHWYWWILANSLYVWMFILKELYLTSMLYALFMILAVYGLIEWKKLLTAQKTSL
jgi:nicotinamide mononucleotide transporter